jgi:hypothetical protein
MEPRRTPWRGGRAPARDPVGRLARRPPVGSRPPPHERSRRHAHRVHPGSPLRTAVAAGQPHLLHSRAGNRRGQHRRQRRHLQHRPGSGSQAAAFSRSRPARRRRGGGRRKPGHRVQHVARDVLRLAGTVARLRESFRVRHEHDDRQPSRAWRSDAWARWRSATCSKGCSSACARPIPSRSRRLRWSCWPAQPPRAIYPLAARPRWIRWWC